MKLYDFIRHLPAPDSKAGWIKSAITHIDNIVIIGNSRKCGNPHTLGFQSETALIPEIEIPHTRRQHAVDILFLEMLVMSMGYI